MPLVMGALCFVVFATAMKPTVLAQSRHREVRALQNGRPLACWHAVTNPSRRAEGIISDESLLKPSMNKECKRGEHEHDVGPA